MICLYLHDFAIILSRPVALASFALIASKSDAFFNDSRSFSLSDDIIGGGGVGGRSGCCTTVKTVRRSVSSLPNNLSC